MGDFKQALGLDPCNANAGKYLEAVRQRAAKQAERECDAVLQGHAGACMLDAAMQGPHPAEPPKKVLDTEAAHPAEAGQQYDLQLTDSSPRTTGLGRGGQRRRSSCSSSSSDDDSSTSQGDAAFCGSVKVTWLYLPNKGISAEACLACTCSVYFHDNLIVIAIVMGMWSANGRIVHGMLPFVSICGG